MVGSAQDPFPAVGSGPQNPFNGAKGLKANKPFNFSMEGRSKLVSVTLGVLAAQILELGVRSDTVKYSVSILSRKVQYVGPLPGTLS